MERTAVFAYASLVDPASAALTLGRPVGRVRRARLRGWRRRWSQARENRLCEKTFARADDGTLPEWILGLNVERDDRGASPPNGALIELRAGEVERLDVRELRYEAVEVTAAVEAEGAPEFDRIVAYVAKPAHHAPDPPAGAVALASYADAVEAAFAALGPDELDEYLRTTGPCPVERIEARLVRDRIPAGNPRAW